jgi:2-phosphosulfolactate phosphatase
MKIDVILTPAEIESLPHRDGRRTVAVVFDVLRATSSMITALAHGAQAIHPVTTIEEARALARRQPGLLLGGERHGDRIEGFDLGNSPLEYREAAGREIVTTTTNGTVALRACAFAERVLAAALLNLDAVARAIARTSPEHLVIVCAGTFDTPALEDILAAGLLCRRLDGADFTDAAQVALAVEAVHGQDPVAALMATRNGRALLAKGREDEIRWCSRLSVFDVLGRLEHGVIRPCAAESFP